MESLDYNGYLGPRLDRETQKKRLLNVIRRELSPKQREAIEAVYFRGMTVTALAAARGVNKSTVSRTLARAKRRIRMFLKY